VRVLTGNGRMSLMYLILNVRTFQPEAPVISINLLYLITNFVKISYRYRSRSAIFFKISYRYSIGFEKSISTQLYTAKCQPLSRREVVDGRVGIAEDI
jgi:hypothetical protein